MLIKFRAECHDDIERLLRVIPDRCIVWYKINGVVLEHNGKSLSLPDEECEMEIKYLAIPDMVDLMSHIPDSHVMQQTIALSEKYTGERDYQDYDNRHQERHKQLYLALNEVALDFIQQTKKLPSKTTIKELSDWAYQQVLNPTMEE